MEEQTPAPVAQEASSEVDSVQAALDAWAESEGGKSAESEDKPEAVAKEEDSAEDLAAGGEEDEEEVEASSEEVEAPEPKEPDLDAAKLATLARQRRKLESEYKEKHAQLEQYASQLEEKVALVKQAEAALELAHTNLPAFLRKIGIKQEQLGTYANQLLGEALGDDAPDELRHKSQQSRVELELQRLRDEQRKFREEQEQFQAQRQWDEKVQAYGAQLRTFVNKVPDGLKYLKAYSESDPDSVYTEMVKVADRHLRQYNEFISPEELARAMEDSLKESFEKQKDLYQRLLGQQPPGAPSQSAQKTLSEKKTSARRTRRKADELSDDDRIKRAIDLWKEEEAQGV